mmetsp:Transcript_36997/g.42519  ORF Transcript_36997/g.42519 Transcript_36997/m.42519 type:complete len:81 (+) Transcript_36997:427-669(+)
MSRSIQHHCQELEIVSSEIKVPAGDYLRNVVQKFPCLNTVTLNTSESMAIEELVRLMPAEDLNKIVEKDNNVAQFKSLLE